MLNAMHLRRPLFVFEIYGRKTFERWPSSGNAEGEEMLKKETTAITEEDVTEAFDVMVCHEVDPFEARARRIAEKTRCNETLILDALTLK